MKLLLTILLLVSLKGYGNIIPGTSREHWQKVTGTVRLVYPGGDGGVAFTNPAWVAGDTIKLMNNGTPWSYFYLSGARGTALNPIVIMNGPTQVVLKNGFDMHNIHHVKLMGTGSADAYGIRVANPTAANSGADGQGVAIGVQGRSSDVFITRIDVFKKTYGAWLKQDPGCVDSLIYPTYHMNNIALTHCRFDSIWQDVIYGGNTDPTGARNTVCGGVTTHPIPMRLSNVRIDSNIISNAGRTGIQLSGCDSGSNYIRGNTIWNMGFELNQQQGTGISIGGMTTNTVVSGNNINTTFLYGILNLGVGTNYICSNLIDSSGWLNGSQNTFSQPVPIFVDTRLTYNEFGNANNQGITLDSSTSIIQNNRLGVTSSLDGHKIYVYQSYKTFNYNKSVIAGNLALDNSTPVLIGKRSDVGYTFLYKTVAVACEGTLPEPPPVTPGYQRTFTNEIRYRG